MCGRFDVDQMLDEMTPQQFTEWQAKDLIEPIGHRGTHEILSLFASMVGAALGNKNLTPQSFMWWRQAEKQRQPDAEKSMEAAAMLLESIGAKRG